MSKKTGGSTSLERNEFVAAKTVQGKQLFDESREEAELQREAAGPGVWPIYHTILIEKEERLIHLMPLAGLGNLENVRCRIDELGLNDEIATYARYLGRDLLEGLQTIHSGHIYHCDLKGANVVTDITGRSGITDFGRATKSSEPTMRNRISDYRYQSPQRWRAGKSGGFQADQDDVWAAGCTLLEFMTGQSVEELFDLPTAMQILQTKPDGLLDHLGARLASISQLQSAPSGSVWAVTRGLLELDPDKRLTPNSALKQRCFENLTDLDRSVRFERLRIPPKMAAQDERRCAYKSGQHQPFYVNPEGGEPYHNACVA